MKPTIPAKVKALNLCKMVEVKGAYNYGRHERTGLKCVQCPVFKFLPSMMDGLMNMTDYRHLYATHNASKRTKNKIKQNSNCIQV